MMSSNGNIFRVTGPLCWEFPGHWWIPLTKASDAELWCFLWSVPEKKRSSKQSRRRYLRPRRAHYDVTVMPRNVPAVFLGNHWSRQLPVALSAPNHYSELDPPKFTSKNLIWNSNISIRKKCIWNCYLQKSDFLFMSRFVYASIYDSHNWNISSDFPLWETSHHMLYNFFSETKQGPNSIYRLRLTRIGNFIREVSKRIRLRIGARNGWWRHQLMRRRHERATP